jgi:hypothetical protein
VLFCGGGNHVDLRDFLVELRGFEPMAIAGAVGLELFLPSPVNSRSRLVARAFSIAIDALASVALFWRRSQAAPTAVSRTAGYSDDG